MRGRCVALGPVLTAAACLEPNPDFVDSASSGGMSAADASAATASAATAGSESADASGSSTGPEAPACVEDAYEPNDSEFTAAMLGELSEEAPPLFLAGRLETPATEDWFRFDGNDRANVPPRIDLVVDTPDGRELGICAFVVCVEGTVDHNITCEGTDAFHAHSIESFAEGCCGTGALQVRAECPDSPDDNDMTVWMRITADAPSSPACIDYVLEYTF